MKYFLVLLLGLCGCPKNSSGTDTLPIADGGEPPDSGYFDSGYADGGEPLELVEVGTGSDFFELVADQQLMPFIQGPQGGGRYEGYHLWGGIRVKGYEFQEATIRLIYLRKDNREEFAYQERILPLQAIGGGYAVAWGFAPRIRDCCLVLATEVIMRAEITDKNGKSGFDEVEVITQDSCVDVLSGLSVCN